jgi:DNA primase
MSVWEDIKSRLSVVDVISEYVPVKRAGQNFKCACPFHNEKTPSLVISPQKNIWHCFGCGVGGDIFGWVSEIENITRAQALKKLAIRAGVELEEKFVSPEQKQAQQEQKTRQQYGFEILQWGAELYHKILLKQLENESSEITKYCQKRKLSLATLQDFTIGYAPSGGFLGNFSHKHNVDISILKEVGLLKEDGKDKFADRFMIPVRDENGRTLGFTGRVLPYDQSERPKYLNSSQSSWFDKSTILYGLDLAKKSIREDRYAILVEGNMDVVSVRNAGIKSILASQGTAVTPLQLKKLKRYTQEIRLALDNDTAGVLASTKTFMAAKKEGFEVKQIVIPKEYKDLDEWRLSGIMPQAIEPIAFLDHQLDMLSQAWLTADKAKQRQLILEFLSLLTVVDVLSQDQYMASLVLVTEFSKEALMIQLNELKTTLTYQESSKVVDSNFNSTQKSLSASPIRKEDANLTCFQEMVAHAVYDTTMQDEVKKAEITAKMKLAFMLMQPFYASLQPSFETWCEEHADEFELIVQSTEPSQDRIKQVSSFINRNVARYLLDTDLNAIYTAWMGIRSESNNM